MRRYSSLNGKHPNIPHHLLHDIVNTQSPNKGLQCFSYLKCNVIDIVILTAKGV